MEKQTLIELVELLVADVHSLEEMLYDIENENGLEDDPSLPDAKWRKTIEHQRNLLDKYSRWLNQRRQEVTTLQEAIRYERERKRHYKDLLQKLLDKHNEIQNL